MRGAVEFPMPEEPDRLEIWRRTFPAEAPLGPDVDLAFLAQSFKLAGGGIRNIVVAAAYAAAERGRALSMADLIRATQREYLKMGRLCVESEFGPYYPLLADAG